MNNGMDYFDKDAQDMRAYESTLFFGELLGEDVSSIATEGMVEIKEKLKDIGKSIADFFIKLKDIIVNFFKNLVDTAEYKIKVPDETRVLIIRAIKDYTNETKLYASKIQINNDNDMNPYDNSYRSNCDDINDAIKKLFELPKNHPKNKEDYTVSMKDCQNIILSGADEMAKLLNIAVHTLEMAYQSDHGGAQSLLNITRSINYIKMESSHMTALCNFIIRSSAKKIKL